MLHSLRIYPLFRMLIFGTLATNTAFWMYQVAVGWLALELTDSAFFVGLAGFVGGIPVLIFSIPAGLIIDRYDRRSVLLLAQLGIMLTAAAFAFFVATDLIDRWSMLVLVFIYGTIMSFVFPTRTAIVPSLVERRDLANAVALNAAGQNATRVVGPSLAGVLIATVGVSGTFAIAAAMQVFALLSTLQLPTDRVRAQARVQSGWESLTLGLRIVARDPFLSALVIIALVPTIFVMPYLNLMPVIARDVLDLGSTGLGVLLASTGLGTVAGALAIAQSPRLRGMARAQVLTALGFAITVLIFALTSSVPLAVVLLFIGGWMSAAFLAINQTAMQLYVDDDVRGRVLSIYLLTWGMLPFGQLIMGLLADQLGTKPAIVICCLAGMAVIGLVYRRFAELRS
jgi:MFS family permease